MTERCDNTLILHESSLAGDARRILSFLEQQGAFRFPTLGTGLFSAAAFEGVDVDLTGYRSVWVRDNIHIAHGHLQWGETLKGTAALRSLMAFFLKHRHRFDIAIDVSSHLSDPMLRPHIRFDGERLAEVDEKWSHAQNDALGAFLWLFSRYCQTAAPGTVTPDEFRLLAEFPRYFKAIQFWQDEDSGHWEEVRKVSASSIGVAVAGLKEFRQLMAANPRLGIPVSLAEIDELIEHGEQALAATLPAECVQTDPAKHRQFDAALLFLIYPFQVVSHDMADRIVANVTTHLMGEHGIRRYIGDSYWCADYKQKLAADQRTVDFSDNLADRDRLLEPGLEAQWCLFDPIVSIHFGLRHQRTGEADDRHRQVLHLQRSLNQLTQPGSSLTPYRCPESYYREQGQYVPNDICPLLWTQTNLKLALQLAGGHPIV
jgi:phosphorylase kinase alpha/beta subunit